MPPSNIIASCTAGLCLIGSALAAPELVECAIQFFATGMHGKGVDLQITRDDDFARLHGIDPITRWEDFDSEKALVLFEGVIDEHNPNKVDVSLLANFNANYSGCSFEELRFGHIIDNGGSDAGSGNCYTVEQTCRGRTSVYGTLYVDVYCNMPYATDSIRMKYFQTQSGRDEVLNC